MADNIIVVDLRELADFLVEAKRSTYATGDEAKVPQDRLEMPGFKELEYNNSGLYYRDHYTGSLAAPGLETVRIGGETGPVIWTMAYAGGMDREHDDLASEAFTFLKSVLAKVTPQAPFRGPSIRGQEWGYAFQHEGDIRSFKGREKVYHYEGIDPVVVFEQDVIGGLVHGKNRLKIVRK